MKHHYWALCLLTFLLFNLNTTAQTLTQTVRGTVIDRDSKVPIIGANIIILEVEPFTGASTDFDGRFVMNKVPVGRHRLKISYLGYEDRFLTNIEVKSGHETVLTIEMVESLEKLDEVVIQANNDEPAAVNEMSVVSTRSVGSKDIQRMAGGLNDPLRVATSYAGVIGGDDEENSISIRGNSPRGLLWQVEGVEVPSPNHFTDEGESSGAVSMFSTFMLSRSDFSTGAFAAQYGNALSGVFDIQLRNGNRDKREYFFEVGLLGIDAGLEGPFVKGKKASYIASYRYSTLTLFPLMGIELTDNATPEYQDFSFKINAPTKRHGKFTVWGVGGFSSIKTEDEGQLSDGTNGVEKIRVAGSDMIALGLGHNYIFNKKTYLQSNVVVTSQRTNFSERRNVTQSLSVDAAKQQFLNLSGKAQFVLNTKFNARHHLKSGLIYSHLYFDLLAEDFSFSSLKLETEVDDNGQSNVLQAYSNWRFRISEKLTMNTGIHALYFFLNNNWTVEPRAAMKWQFLPKQSLSFGFGMHSRMESLSTYLYKKEKDNGTIIMPSKNLDFVKALHYVLAYEHRLAPNVNLKVEVYYQDIYNVPIKNNETSNYSVLNENGFFTKTNLVNRGTGENYGIELTLEKYFSRSYYLMFSGSVFQSKYVAGDGIKRNTEYNKNFAFNFVGGKEFKVGKERQNTISLSTRATVVGGLRYTPVDEEASAAAGYYVEDEYRLNSKKTEPYHRIDLAFSFTKLRKKVSMTWKLDIQNLTNQQNIQDIDFSKDEGVEFNRRGQFLPVASWRLEF